MGGWRETELRGLPAVHELAAALDAPHALAVAAARRAIDEHRSLLLSDAEQPETVTDLAARARGHLATFAAPSLRHVINATGVLLHTNLGRAPLSLAAREAVATAAEGYSNLELDLPSGQRGSRHDHVEALLCELTGAQAAMAVNNCAGAVLLAAAALGGPDRAIVVSRGQLVEIGGGFRIPEVIAQSRSTMIEVGTTNRTHRRDYERALRTAPLTVGAILRVHQSNFRTLGFVEDVEIEELCGLGAPVIDDVGSGLLSAPATTQLGDEPDVRRSVQAGAALVCYSGDKLLGGPQAGLIVGSEAAVAAAREHPLARALRIDKLSLAALQATLMLYRDPPRAWREIPVLRMLAEDEDTLAARAQRLGDAIGPLAEVVRNVSRTGGGALPLSELEGPAVALAAEVDPERMASALRHSEPPVLARIHAGRLVLDPRTLTDDEVPVVGQAVRDAVPRT
ncbi:MAG: L-seryl-tRNA(Sec) selenium transferase [Actinomycetota bacterium]|nr:L-seryl-tRNA(Sec) selenium transferase [Actinomycetota bacterium]